MIHFYILDDDQPKPATPQELKYAGVLDEDMFERLQHKGIIHERFDCYSHFRWGTDLITQIRRAISEKKMDQDIDVKHVVLLLDLARAHHSGLMAYGD